MMSNISTTFGISTVETLGKLGIRAGIKFSDTIATIGTKRRNPDPVDALFLLLAFRPALLPPFVTELLQNVRQPRPGPRLFVIGCGCSEAAGSS